MCPPAPAKVLLRLWRGSGSGGGGGGGGSGGGERRPEFEAEIGPETGWLLRDAATGRLFEQPMRWAQVL